MRIVDTHAHLDFPELEKELEAVVNRAKELEVDRIITIGTELESSRRAVEIAKQFPGTVFAAVGVHPTSVHEVTAVDWINQLRELAAHESVVAIGEIGHDNYHQPRGGFSAEAFHERQADFFRKQMDLAVELKKNVVIHQRGECWEDVREILTPYQGKTRCVFHCYSRSWDEAEELISEGHLVSFTGIVTFKNAKEVHETVRRARSGHFMVETDSPFLAPVPKRGKRCEPGYTRYTAEGIAKLREVSVEQIAEETTKTAETFFGLP